MGTAWAALAGLAGLALAACVEPGGFACDADAQCVRDGVQGVCTLAERCSFPADDCATRARYSPYAGDGLAGQCVEESDFPEGTAGLDPKLPATLLDHSPEIGDPHQIVDGDPALHLWSSKPGPRDGWHYVDLDLGGHRSVTALRLIEDNMATLPGWGIDQWEFEILDGGTQTYWSGTMDSTTNEWQTIDHPDHAGDRVRLWLFSSNLLVSVREVEVRGRPIE